MNNKLNEEEPAEKKKSAYQQKKEQRRKVYLLSILILLGPVFLFCLVTGVSVTAINERDLLFTSSVLQFVGGFGMAYVLIAYYMFKIFLLARRLIQLNAIKKSKKNWPLQAQKAI